LQREEKRVRLQLKYRKDQVAKDEVLTKIDPKRTKKLDQSKLTFIKSR
jgi:hypothetical protein